MKPKLKHVLTPIILLLSFVAPIAAQETPRFKEVRPPDAGTAPNVEGVRPQEAGPAPRFKEVWPPDTGPAPRVEEVRPPENGPPPKVKEGRPDDARTAPKVEELRPADARAAPKVDGVRPPDAKWSFGFTLGRNVMSLMRRIFESKEIVSALMALAITAGTIIIIVRKRLIPNDRVRWAVTHQHAFLLIQPNSPQTNPPLAEATPQQLVQPPQRPPVLFTRTICVQNVGRARVEGVEIILAASPHHIGVSPQRRYTITAYEQRDLALQFGGLDSQETITLALLNIGLEVPDVKSVLWNGVVAHQTPMAPQQMLPRWAMLSLWCLIPSGVVFWLYIIIRLALGLIGSTFW